MKKIFLFAIAAVGMTVGCQKFQEIFNPGQDSLDDGSPVPVLLGTNVSATATTKAAVNSVTDLHDETINVFCLKKGATDLTAEANYKLGSSSEPYKITLKEESGDFNYDPYTTDQYYGTKNDDTYNFYGYYVGEATVGTRKNDGATITVPVEISGQDDILLAETDRDADVIASGKVVDRNRVYSAYSARRDVVPNLVFEHQLAQLTFKLVNGTTLNGNAKLKVTSLVVKSESKANLVITNDGESKFEPTPDQNGASVKAFELKDTDGNTVTQEFSSTVTENTLPGSIMVIPGVKEYDMTIHFTQNSGVAEATDHTDKVDLAVALASGEDFKAGFSYEVTIKIYASEAVLLDVSVVEWKKGEDVTIDQDKDDDVVRDNTKLYAVPTTANDPQKIAYEVNVPDSMDGYTIEAALSESQESVPDDAKWVALVDTKSTEPLYALFDEYLAGKIYYCHLRYKASDADEYTDVAPTEATDYCIAPKFAFIAGKARLVTDKNSYNELPEFYTSKFPWEDNEANLTTGPNKLPWLVAEYTPVDEDVVDVKKDGKVIRTLEGDNWRLDGNGLITVCAAELGFEELPDGEYSFVICGVESEKITVDTSKE